MNKQEPFVNTGKKSLLNWIEHMDVAFVDAMVQQQEKGNRLHGNFTSQAYANMVEELNKKLNMNLTKSHLKNHLKTLKSGFSQWYDMFNGISLSRFSWNADTQLIEADDTTRKTAFNDAQTMTRGDLRYAKARALKIMSSLQTFEG
uniref:Myb/SANT-like domain-containing protein n=1 Tax=Lactuca sativa TaxID=4236 RepID=A0A9R1W0R6_LACSA|nr:hypothetical protein LSAT_V11C300154490 [Lactuca sativa]